MNAAPVASLSTVWCTTLLLFLSTQSNLPTPDNHFTWDFLLASFSTSLKWNNTIVAFGCAFLWPALCFVIYPCHCLSFPLSCLVQSICCCVNVPQFVYSPICWRTFGLLPALTVINRRAMNIHVQMFLQTYVSSSLGRKPRSEMATPWCMNVLSILIAKNPQKIV